LLILFYFIFYVEITLFCWLVYFANTSLFFIVSTKVAKWFDEANNMMKSTWIKACKVDCLKPSWSLMEF